MKSRHRPETWFIYLIQMDSAARPERWAEQERRIGRSIVVSEALEGGNPVSPRRNPPNWRAWGPIPSSARSEALEFVWKPAEEFRFVRKIRFV